jgi:anaerobic selenocysteine-containing dehydrogenase
MEQAILRLLLWGNRLLRRWCILLRSHRLLLRRWRILLWSYRLLLRRWRILLRSHRLLLPDLMTVEQEDIIPNDYAGNMGYLIFLQPATSPKFERKPIYWIMSEVAKRLGKDVYDQFTEGRTQAEWLQYLYAKMVDKDPLLPSYDELKTMGIYKRRDPNGHFVAYKKFRQDPLNNPLKTPSGKIEIYSSKLADIARSWELEKDEEGAIGRSMADAP